MKRFLATVAMAAVSASAFSQMMGAQMSTSSYFPMVDGARYEYMHAGGTTAMSAAVMRSGQTWAGQAGLYAMHYTYTCNIGAACATDATHFYGMGPDGVHYFGGTGANPTGTQYSMMTLTSPEWVMKNPVTPGTMMGGGGFANAESWSMGVAGTGSTMGSQSYMSSYSAQALETVVTPAGTFSNVLHIRERSGSSISRDVWYASGVGMVMMDDGTQVMKLSGYTMPGAVAQPAGGSAALPFTPVNGMWWNPNESGTGYSLQTQRGVMVVAMFSYTSAGDPVWYYAPGRLSSTGAGVTMSSTLDRYRGGQCASCGYMAPNLAGNDGSFSIEFSSPTSATVRLPGGRTTAIQPQPW
ncbi:MAG: hypothetical protein IPP91_19780 [Betaproteobacteria bacterium]|nr:hypothetical protein [Betaproteobacteria bacterium]